MVDYVKEMPSKKSIKYGENGSFEHVLFLLSYLYGSPGSRTLRANTVISRPSM